MRDWRDEVRRRVATADLAPADEADVVEELTQHLEDLEAELLAGGTDAAAAAAAVAAELGARRPLAAALAAVRARSHGPRRPLPAPGAGPVAGLGSDLRAAVRALRTNPGYAAAAVLTLALGTGAATAVFSLLHGVVLAPLPYREPDRLVRVWETHQEKGLAQEPVSPVNLMDYRRLEAVFTDIAGWWRPEMNLADASGAPIQVSTVEASENLFALLGVQPVLGRSFPRDDTLWGSEREAVISHRLWRSRFAADPGVLGHVLSLNGFPYTVVGVMPAGFHFPDDTDVWERLGWDLEQHSRGAHFMGAVGRLRPGVTLEAADRELAALGERLAAAAPRTNRGWSARVVPLARDVAGLFRPGFLALFGAAGLLLLIACINVAGLGLARATARRGDLSVRLALGADRFRLLRGVLVESALLSTLGGALGLGVALVAVHGLLAWSPIPIPRAADVRLDAAVLVFTLAATAGCAVLAGAAPALLASRTAVRRSLSDAGRGATGGRGGRRLRAALVVAQVALSVVLLAGAGMLIRSVARLLSADLGVSAADALGVDLQLPDAEYGWERVAPFYTGLLAGLRDRPQVADAGVASFLPVDPGWRVPFTVPGAPEPPHGEEGSAQIHSVDEGWFHALGVPLRRGRGFTAADRADAPGVVVVNETLARQVWPGRDPVGRRLVVTTRAIGPLGRRLVAGDEHRVVGVVADVRNAALDAPAEPAIYFSQRQFPYRKMHLVVRGPGDAASLLTAVREEVRRLDPALPLGEVDALEHALRATADPARFVMLLMAVFAATSLALTVLGIYGLLAYSLARRRREIGLRLVLGARRGDVVALVVREGLALALAGIALGLAATLAGGRLLSGLLPDLRPGDPAVLAATCALVAGVSLAAGLLPGRRAAGADPAESLRAD